MHYRKILNSTKIEKGLHLIYCRKSSDYKKIKRGKQLLQLITKIAEKQEGDLKNIQNLFIHLLQLGEGSYEELYMKEAAVGELHMHGLLDLYRVVEIKMVNHTPMAKVHVYYSPQTYDNEQMKRFIDATLNFAKECGVEKVDEYWKGKIYD